VFASSKNGVFGMPSKTASGVSVVRRIRGHCRKTNKPRDHSRGLWYCRSNRCSQPAYLLPSARFFWYSLTISSWMLRGTGWYFLNSMENSPLPWVTERRSVE